MTQAESSFRQRALSFLLITLSAVGMGMCTHFFSFPNHFSFGGVSGLSVILAKLLPVPPSTVNLILNMGLLLLGFLVLGKGFGAKTAWASVVLTFTISLMDQLFPLSGPLTDQPLLELCFAVAIPGVCGAVLFTRGASSGGTDIIAMILKKYTRIQNIGTALQMTDCVVAFSSFFVYDVRTGLFSVLGLAVKGLVIDNVIESIHLCKYFSIVCDDPQPICDFIFHQLHRGASVCEATGAYTGETKYLVMTALHREQALALQQFVRRTEPSAFITIMNTSEIIGKGFFG
ncbi:MAG: YitT family protein [Pygmaiobacter massiliensis]|jgi:uncharacterized membrane-anchored protein YitT (DUF2179 family)|nr:YitT family protein [Pygmaiobacter massiliensis]